MSERTYLLQIEPAGEPSRWVRGIQHSQLIDCIAHVGAPCHCECRSKLGALRTANEFNVILWRSGNHPPIREHGYDASIRCIESDHHVAVTGEIFRERGILR